MLRLAGKAFSQVFVLRGDADRASPEMALPHQQAAERHQRGSAEAESLGPQQSADHHVAAGSHLAVDLNDDPIAQAVEHQRLLRLGQTELPRRSGMFDRAKRAGAGSAVVAADEHLVGVALGHARRHGADADFGDQLHGDQGVGVGALQIVDQLREVFDRVDVVVRGRRNQRNPGRRMPQPGDFRGHFVRGQLAAFAGLRTLGHLDLKNLGVGQILDRHAEPGAGHLLDPAIHRVAVGQRPITPRILAALAGVRVRSQPVHGDGQRFVGFLADRTVRHRAGVESLDDLGGRLDLFERNRLARHEREQAAERHQIAALVVHRLGVLGIDLRIVLEDGVLQLDDRVGIPEMLFAVEPELVLAAEIEFERTGFERLEGGAVPRDRLARDHVEIAAGDPRGRAGEIAVDDGMIEPDGLELLGELVAAERGNAHFRDRLEDSLLDGRDVLVGQDVGGDAGRQIAVGVEFLDRLEGEVGIDGAGAVAAEHTEVHHLARLGAFDHDAHLASQLAVPQIVIQSGGGQQTGDRRASRRDVAVAGDQHRRAVGNRAVRRVDQVVQTRRQRPARIGIGRRKQRGNRSNFEIVAPGRPQPLHVVVRQDRVRKLQLPAVLRRLVEQIPLAAGERHQRHDQPFAQRIDRRVGHLGEKLLEVIEQQLGAIREDGQRRVGAHRADRLLPVGRHRRDDQLQIFARVAEASQPLGKRLRVHRRGLRGLKQTAQLDAVLFKPAPVGLLPRNSPLDLAIDHDSAFLGIDQEHAAGLKTAFLLDLIGWKIDNPHLARQHGQPFGRDDVPAGTQPIAIQRAAHEASVGENHRGRAVPGLHDRGVVFVKRPLVGRHVVLRPERLGNHHHHRVRRRSAGADQQLEGVVEARRVASAGLDDRK